MIPPTLFISGGMAVLHLCNEVYTRLLSVRRYRKDCEKLARFVHRIEAFITETEEDADMTTPGWQAAFSALHDALLEVVAVFEGVASYGMIRSLINADELNLRLNSISQRLMLALQLIPIQKAKATDKRLGELQAMQLEIRTATFATVRAAEEQSAALKRLMDQSRVDTSKTHEMLAQVLLLLQSDPTRCAAASAAGHTHGGDGGGPHEPCRLEIDPDQLHAELADLHAELEVAVRNKNVTEEDYLEQIIAAISAMEEQLQQQAPQQQQQPVPQPPVDLLCPITLKLLEDPVILIDSAHTYERAAIQEWLDRGNRKDPVSGIQLNVTVIVPNIAIRKMAQDWAQANPGYKQQQQQQEEATLRASTAGSAQQPLFPAGTACDAAALSTEKGGKDLQAVPSAPGDCCFNINPKTAAILAAGEQAGFSISDSFDPAKLAASLSPVGSSASCAEGVKGEQDKKQAQQAYARAVAAAAAAESSVITAMPAVAWSAGRTGEQTNQLQSVDSGGSRCSSITFARGNSASTVARMPVLPATPEATVAATTAAASSDINLYPAAQASAAGPSRQHQQQQRQQSPRQQSPRQQQQLPRGFNLQGRRSRTDRAAAASAAAAAVLAQQRGGAGFNLLDLHGALDRAADSRYAMTNRLRGADAAEAVRETTQQLRQEREVQRQQLVQQEEREYLHQHMERLMQEQPQQPRAHPASSTTLSTITSGVPVPTVGWASTPAGSTASVRYAASAPAMALGMGGPVSTHAAAAAVGAQYPAQQQRRISPQHSWDSDTYPQPSAPTAPRSESYSQTRRAVEQQAPPVVQHSNTMPSSFFGRFKKGGSQAGSQAGDAVPSSVCDDTASVSSYGSSSSRRSMRSLMGGAMKNLKYAMVYDDTKV